MIALDVSCLAPDVANVLMLRGAELPPLQWHDKPNRAAKQMLLGIKTDAALLRQNPLANDAMGRAVRAALYLWNGWLEDCMACAQEAPSTEQYYFSALCERHSGRPNDCKTVMQQVDVHPIYAPLCAYAVEKMGLATDPPLKRIKGLLELGETWEPFAFVDLYEQARAGKLCSPTEQIVRSLQCREFELLFAHCYEVATGQKLPEEEVAGPAVRRRSKPRSRQRPHRSPVRDSAAPNSKTDSTPNPGAKGKEPRVGIECPKCAYKMVFPESCRGSKNNCAKCGTVFIIPQRSMPAASS